MAKQMSEWIDIEEEWPEGNLPDFGVPVLLCCEYAMKLNGEKTRFFRSIEIGTHEWDGEQEKDMWYTGDKRLHPTHWMPLPPFPEE